MSDSTRSAVAGDGKEYNSTVAAAIQLLPVAVPVVFMGLLVEVICRLRCCSHFKSHCCYKDGRVFRKAGRVANERPITVRVEGTELGFPTLLETKNEINAEATNLTVCPKRSRLKTALIVACIGGKML
jgi:hypothetical protein